MYDKMVDLVIKNIEKEFEHAKEKFIEESIEDFSRKIREKMLSCAIRAQDYFDFNCNEQTMVIHLKSEPVKKIFGTLESKDG